MEDLIAVAQLAPVKTDGLVIHVVFKGRVQVTVVLDNIAGLCMGAKLEAKNPGQARIIFA